MRSQSTTSSVDPESESLAITYFNNEDPSTDAAGGGEVRMWEEATFLAQEGHNVTLVCGRSDPNLPPVRRDEGVTVRTIKTVPDWLARFESAYFYLSRSLFALFSLVYLLDGGIKETDIAIDNLTPHPSLAGLIAPILGIPATAIVHEFHDQTALRKYNPIIGLIQLIAQNSLRIGIYDAVVVPNEVTKQELKDFGVRSPVTVIPNGIHLDEYATNPVYSDDLKYDFVAISRLVHRKGIDRLLDSFAEVVTKCPDATLAIAGKGPKRDQYIEKCQLLNIEDNVEFLGYVEESTKAGLLKQSDVFVSPSRQEGFGIVVLEALAAGIPVVANDLPIFRSWIPSSSVEFVDADCSSSFASSLSRIYDDETKQAQLSLRGQKVAKNYSWDKVAIKSESVYKKISEGTKRQI